MSMPPLTQGGSEKIVMCGCGERAAFRTVAKEGPNKGKNFWACLKGMTEPTNCKFFVSETADDVVWVSLLNFCIRNGMKPLPQSVM
jgi:hypothetical protein